MLIFWESLYAVLGDTVVSNLGLDLGLHKAHHLYFLASSAQSSHLKAQGCLRQLYRMHTAQGHPTD